MMRASALEYRLRYLVHGLIYTLGFAAPWHPPMWGFARNGSSIFLAANSLAKPSYQHFALYWNLLVIVVLACAIVGAVLRTWGAAYLGAATVQHGSMVGDQFIADGPFRFTRNPLYLGTIFNTLALASLMRPEAAVLTIVLITLVQYRLIGREEPYLAQQLGQPYARYLATVPRLLPALRPHGVPSGARPSWRQGVLSEIYVIGCVVAIGAFAWSTGYEWEASVLRIMQAIVISLGLSFVARAFIPAKPPAMS